MVRPENFVHDVINFRDIRLVDFLTQNPVQAGDSMTISLQRCIEVTTHNLLVMGMDIGYQRQDAVV